MKTVIRTISILIVITLGNILISYSLPPKSIYSIKLRDIDGRVTELIKYRGKKMVFITLSGAETDSALQQLSDFCLKYKDSAFIAGIPSMEDGYNESKKDAVKKLYKKQAPGIFLAEAMYTRKTSTSQSELMQWFTHREQNMRFDNDVTGPGWKFFVDEGGMLYGALGPNAGLTSMFIQRAMSNPVRQLPQAQAAPLQKKSN